MPDPYLMVIGIDVTNGGSTRSRVQMDSVAVIVMEGAAIHHVVGPGEIYGMTKART